MKRFISEVITSDFHTPNDVDVWEFLVENFEFRGTGGNVVETFKKGSRWITPVKALNYVFQTSAPYGRFITTKEFKCLIGMPDAKKKDFSKKDLISGEHIAKLKSGEYFIVLGEGGVRLGNLLNWSWVSLDEYKEDLTYCATDSLDIVAVYSSKNLKGCSSSMDTESLEENLIWERTEKSKQQLEKESIEEEMRLLADRLNKLEL